MKKGQQNPRASRNWIRPDYRRKQEWTIAETADYCGVSVKTVDDWLSSGRVARAFLIGPFRVDRDSVDRLLKTGERQGVHMPLRLAK